MPVFYTVIQQKAPPKSGRGQEYIYYPRIVYNRRVGTGEIAEAVSKASSITRGDLAGALYGVDEEMAYQLSEGNKVVLDGIGSFYVTARTGAVQNPEDIRSSDFHRRGVGYEPDRKLVSLLDKYTFVRKDL